jgi:hypothetical protein
MTEAVWEQISLNFGEVAVNKYQETSLDIYLSAWPRDWDYAEVVELVASGKPNEYVTPWEPFERMDSDRLAGEIEATTDLLEMRFIARTSAT